MQDTLWLLSGGKGHLQSRSVLQGVEDFPLKWRHIEPGLLFIDKTYPDDDPDEESYWRRVKYCASTVKIDVAGATIHVLHSVGYKEFWDLVGPIGFVCPVEGLTLPSFLQDADSSRNEGSSR